MIKHVNKQQSKQSWCSVSRMLRGRNTKVSLTAIERLGYPKWLEDHQNIDRFYQNLVLSPANNSITNFLLVRRFHQEQNLKKLVRSSYGSNRRIRTMFRGNRIWNQTLKNGRWHPSMSMLTMRHGRTWSSFQPVSYKHRKTFCFNVPFLCLDSLCRFFDPNVPISLNFGSIASIIGRRFNPEGVLTWTSFRHR